jgi:hypothetical protein
MGNCLMCLDAISGTRGRFTSDNRRRQSASKLHGSMGRSARGLTDISKPASRRNSLELYAGLVSLRVTVWPRFELDDEAFGEPFGVCGGLALLSDCHRTFPPLTDLTSFFYVGGDGQQVMPDPSTTATAAITLPRPLQAGVVTGHIRSRVPRCAVEVVKPPPAGTVNGHCSPCGSRQA